jgi:predicted HicB family RNase H-like nuclease
MNCLEYKGYIGSIDVDFQGNFLHGKLLYIRDLVTYQGNSPEELRLAFEESVDFYLEDCAESGEEPDRPFKGSFNVRISPDLHKELAMCARSLGRSLNDYVGSILRNHQNFDTHKKVAEAATEAAWLAIRGFGKSQDVVVANVRIVEATHSQNVMVRHKYGMASQGADDVQPTIEFKPSGALGRVQ